MDFFLGKSKKTTTRRRTKGTNPPLQKVEPKQLLGK
jgi:hypothetical protein